MRQSGICVTRRSSRHENSTVEPGQLMLGVDVAGKLGSPCLETQRRSIAASIKARKG
jgi:hypothetical protein